MYMIRSIMQGSYRFGSPEWDDVSIIAKDLVSHSSHTVCVTHTILIVRLIFQHGVVELLLGPVPFPSTIMLITVLEVKRSFMPHKTKLK